MTAPDLRTHYLGLELRSPIVASPGPITADVDRLVAAVDAGVGAVVLPSLFEEQIEHETAEIDRLFSVNADSFGEALSYFPEVDGYETAVDLYLRLIEEAKRRVDVPVVASFNGIHQGAWVRYVSLLEDAGADAIELNLYSVAADPAVAATAIESEQVALVSDVVAHLHVPVAVKVSPFYTSFGSFALALQDAGAAGLVVFNRFYLPDLDPETLELEPRLSLSTSEELRLPLRWIGILREHLTMSIAATTGIHTGVDAAKVILAGADVAMTTSALLRYGPAHAATIEEGLVAWMADHEYDSIAEMRGAVRREATADPVMYERANYIGNLATFTSQALGGPMLRLREAD
jgi:dihydroorotate dehydrogenase (fumarate)